MRDAVGELQCLQRITPNGTKLFLAGGRTAGLHWCIPSNAWSSNSPVVVVESMATAATIAEALALPVVVAFTASNLLEVSKRIRRSYPGRPLVIAGDNDAGARINVGVLKAQDAADAVAGRVWVPSFQPGSGGTDWNDFGAIYGKDAILASFYGSIQPSKYVMESCSLKNDLPS
jgi:putative DNA primase/helicase